MNRNDSSSIQISGACKSYESWGRKVVALKDLTLNVPGGQITVIMGANGSGKSTILRAVGNLIQLDQGRIEIGGKRLQCYKKEELASTLGFLHQAPAKSLCINFTVEEMVHVYLEKMNGNLVQKTCCQLRRDEISLTHKVRSLSGGQQQLLALTLILSRNPNILLLDEPTASLDTRHSKEIIKRIREARDNGVTALLISHKVEEGLQMAQNVVFLNNGKLAGEWRGRDIATLTADRLRRLMSEMPRNASAL